ncbi:MULTISPECIES: hypothetical protein [unclassified Streptomyces]|uniref:hypothetical protein n=1 Tax=unclassified Streptomyces TaxID=2593676 RepID=UPI0036EEE921
MSAPSTVQWLTAAVRRIDIGSRRRATYLTVWTVHRARRRWNVTRAWLDEGTGFGWLLRAALLLGAAALLRKTVTAIAVGIYHRVEDGGAPWLLWAAAASWTVSAYRAGAEGWKPKRPAVPDAEEQEKAPTDDEQPDLAAPQQAAPAVPPVSPVALIAAVRDIGTPHAQLKPLAERLGTTTDAVRAAAAGLGWTVKDVRMQGRSASAGLRWDEVPSPPPLDPSPGVVGAGQPADDNDDDRVRAVLVQDRENPVRTHVVWRDH